MTKLGIGIRGKAVMVVFVQLLGSALADQFLPTLETRTGVYSNVTVTLKTGRDIHIRHAGGIANIDLEDLDDEVKVELGYVVEQGESTAGEMGKALPAEWMKVFESVRGEGDGGQAPLEIPVVMSPKVIGIVLLTGLLFHLFFAYCSRLICIKAGSDPGFLIWLPVLQIFPMFKAAGMSRWWVLGLLVPVLNLVVQVLWCIKIVGARGKHVVWAILLILPLVNLFAFLYLAFSSDGGSGESLDFPSFSPRPV